MMGLEHRLRAKILALFIRLEIGNPRAFSSYAVETIMLHPSNPSTHLPT